MNEIEFQNKKKAKIEQHYENYIKSLNEQIYRLESQIEVLQNKVLNLSGNFKKENNYNINLNLLREQIIHLQKENQKLTQIIKMKENIHNNNMDINPIVKNKQKKNKKQLPIITHTNRTTESENEYVKQFINDFHKQIDELNIDNNIIANEQKINILNNKIINNNNNNNNKNRFNIDENYENEDNDENDDYNSNEINPNDINSNYLNN